MATRDVGRGRPALVLARNPESPPNLMVTRVAMGDQTKLFDPALRRPIGGTSTCETRRMSLADFDEAWRKVRNGQAGGGECALALLAAARGPFESIGMPEWLRRADELRE